MLSVIKKGPATDDASDRSAAAPDPQAASVPARSLDPLIEALDRALARTARTATGGTL